MAATARDMSTSRHTERHQTKEGLSSWWSRFKARPGKKEPAPPRGIFGVALQESIQYANVAISLYNDHGQPFIYGYIPIVVAKCGLYLKEEATETEGIFRVSGSAKRIKELQDLFDAPPKYGKGLDWRATGFTVHDAANILRRYLNQLPEPIVPTEWYDDFREPLKREWPLDQAIARMQHLVSSLPPLNRQLLLYILDLLAVFASKSEVNRMTSENLSAIFQPGILTHPRDVMAPEAYRLSQEVLVFLIDNQAHFLLDMCAPYEQPAPASPAVTKTSVTRRRTIASRRTSAQASPQEPAVAAFTPADISNLHIPPRGATPLSRASSGAANLSRSNTVPTKRSAQSPPIGFGQSTAPGIAATGSRAVSSPITPSDPQTHMSRRVPVALEDKPIDETPEHEISQMPPQTGSTAAAATASTAGLSDAEVRAKQAQEAVEAAKPAAATGATPTIALPIAVSSPVTSPAPEDKASPLGTAPVAIPAGKNARGSEGGHIYQARSPVHSRTSLHALGPGTGLAPHEVSSHGSGGKSPRSVTPASFHRAGSRRASLASASASATQTDAQAGATHAPAEFSVLGGRKLSASELPHVPMPMPMATAANTLATGSSIPGSSPPQSLSVPGSSIASARDKSLQPSQSQPQSQSQSQLQTQSQQSVPSSSPMSSSPSRLSNLFRRARNAHSSRHDRESISSTSESALRRDLDK